jgi:hypothetical protein
MNPCQRESLSSRYRLSGNFVAVPAEAVVQGSADGTEVFEACKDETLMLLSPLPSYITADCRDDQDDGTDWSLASFRSHFISYLGRPKKL